MPFPFIPQSGYNGTSAYAMTPRLQRSTSNIISTEFDPNKTDF